MSQFLTGAPRILLLALLVFAPWAYGSVRPWTQEILGAGMLLLLLFWIISLFARRTAPRVPRLLWVLVGLVLVYGWWMVANAHYFYDRVALRFDAATPLVAWAPGVVDRADAAPLMVRLTYLLGVLCFTCDLAQRREWRRALVITMAACGFSLIFFGLIQRMLAAPMIFWGRERLGTTFFATYFYHGNAGAYINLVLPITAGMAYLATQRGATTMERAIWYPALLVAIAGSLVAASKAAVVITGFLLLVLIIWRWDTVRQTWRRLNSPAARAVSVILTLIALGAIGFFGWDRLQQRVAEESWQVNSVESRMLVYRVCWQMIAESSLWGFGPGNFMICFPHYTLDLGNRLEGIWQFAHQDYLQTVIEWGWIGASFWALIFLGGIFSGTRSLRRTMDSRFDRMIVFTSLLSIVGVCLHASVDFPLQIPSLQLYVATFLGILWSSPNWYEEEEDLIGPVPAFLAGQVSR